MVLATHPAPLIARHLLPLRIHPENPKLFEFRGKPFVFVTATEHYGAVMNRPFRFERYLPDAAEKGITLTRLFTLFRELPAARGLPPDIATEAEAGRPIAGSIELDLADGSYWVATYDPTTGLYSPATVLEGGAVSLRLPPFTHDLVVHLTIL